MARALNRPWIESGSTESDAVAEDEVRLVERAKRDRAAFGVLYDRYLTPIYRYCFLRLGSRETAEDATSVIFAKALHGIGGCRPERFRSWLFAIARNVVVDGYRARGDAEPIEQAMNLADPGRSPLDEALRSDDERRVVQLLRQLTAEQREIVELRLAGLTGSEIAAALNRSPGAIRAAQFRAYARLRELLADQPDSEGRSR
jgi:RNA polymerase sigma-70 factor (ECF subfamily)